MDSNGNGNGTLSGPPPEQGQMPQIPMAKFECSNCKKEMVARLPVPQIFNFATCSGIVFSHERVQRCPHCGAAYLPMVGGLGEAGDIQIAWMPVQTRQQAIVPPSLSQIDSINKSKLKM